MKTRVLAIYTSQTVNLHFKDKMDFIVDEVYLFATNGDYSTCAYETFSRILEVLSGENNSDTTSLFINAFVT